MNLKVTAHGGRPVTKAWDRLRHILIYRAPKSFVATATFALPKTCRDANEQTNLNLTPTQKSSPLTKSSLHTTSGERC